MFKFLPNFFLISLLLTKICYTASYNCKAGALLIYEQKPQPIALYIASYYDEQNLTLIVNKLLDDITASSPNIEHIKEIIHTACAEKAKQNPHKFCFIELFTQKTRVRSTFTKDYHFKESEPFNPWTQTIILAYPKEKNHLALFLDLERLRSLDPIEE